MNNAITTPEQRAIIAGLQSGTNSKYAIRDALSTQAAETFATARTAGVDYADLFAHLSTTQESRGDEWMFKAISVIYRYVGPWGILILMSLGIYQFIDLLVRAGAKVAGALSSITGFIAPTMSAELRMLEEVLKGGAAGAVATALEGAIRLELPFLSWLSTTLRTVNTTNAGAAGQSSVLPGTNIPMLPALPPAGSTGGSNSSSGSGAAATNLSQTTPTPNWNQLANTAVQTVAISGIEALLNSLGTLFSISDAGYRPLTRTLAQEVYEAARAGASGEELRRLCLRQDSIDYNMSV